MKPSRHLLFILTIFLSFTNIVLVAQVEGEKEMHYDTELGEVERAAVKRLTASKKETLRSIEAFKSVEELFLETDGVNIESNFSQLKSLRSFCASDQHMKFSEHIEALPQLEIFNAFATLLEELPAFLRQCPRLQKLDVCITKTTTFTEQLAQLPSLRTLNLAIQDFSSFPEHVLQVKQLEKLVLTNYADQTTIIALPKEIVTLSQLSYLEAPVDLSQDIEILKALTQLKVLKIKQCSNFEESYEALKQLSFLERIYIEDFSDEQIKKLKEILPQVKFGFSELKREVE